MNLAALSRAPAALLLLACVFPMAGSAQQQGLAFDLRMGHSTIGGDWGTVLTDGVDAELNLYYSFANRLRIGWGLNQVSYELVDELHTEETESASQTGMQFSAMYPFQIGQRLWPYVEGRFTWDRFKAEGEVEGFPPPEEEGENNAPRYSGWGGTASVGLLVNITGRLYGDFSYRYGNFDTNDIDLDEYLPGAGVVTSGSRYGFRVGLLWYLRNDP
jgi:opacity protein-like surface antigen